MRVFPRQRAMATSQGFQPKRSDSPNLSHRPSIIESARAAPTESRAPALLWGLAEMFLIRKDSAGLALARSRGPVTLTTLLVSKINGVGMLS
jgi:hypothetical protein